MLYLLAFLIALSTCTNPFTPVQTLTPVSAPICGVSLSLSQSILTSVGTTPDFQLSFSFLQQDQYQPLNYLSQFNISICNPVSTDGTLFLNGKWLYDIQSPNISYSKKQYFQTGEISMVSENGRVFVGGNGSIFDVWVRNGQVFEILQRIDNGGRYSTIEISKDGGVIALCMADRVVLYTHNPTTNLYNQSSFFMSLLPFTSFPKIKALSDFSTVFAYADDFINIFVYNGTDYNFQQCIQVQKIISSISVDGTFLAIRMLGITRIFSIIDQMYRQVQVLEERVDAVAIRGRVMVTVKNDTMVVWRRSENQAEQYLRREPQ